jgi:hypothetical protein
MDARHRVGVIAVNALMISDSTVAEIQTEAMRCQIADLGDKMNMVRRGRAGWATL